MVFPNALALGLALVLGLAGLALGRESAAPQPYVNYSTVTGYFLQDEPSTDPSTFNYVSRFCFFPRSPPKMFVLGP
jgi:hypothetical protein